jgi:hypothetical protein
MKLKRSEKKRIKDYLITKNGKKMGKYLFKKLKKEVKKVDR